MHRKIRRLFLPGIPVLFGALFVACHSESESGSSGGGTPPAAVRTTEVVLRTFSGRFEAIGTVRALEAIEVSSNVTERVAEIFFEDGETVKKGQLLVRLEDAEEKAILEGAMATEAEQEREIERLGDLVTAGAVSDVRLQEYETRRDVAARRVEEAEARIGDRNIRAPFDGVLGFRQVSLGALVEPGDVIATLDILDPIKLDFNVPETFLGSLKRGVGIDARSQAYPGESFRGTIVRIDTRVNPVTRSVTVRAEIPNPGLKLRPGMLMTTVIESNLSRSLSVPERSLVSDQRSHFVFVVVGDPAGEAAASVARRSVEIGRRTPGFVEIRHGLEENQRVVTDGLIGLGDGSEVKITGKFEAPAEPYQPLSQP